PRRDRPQGRHNGSAGCAGGGEPDDLLTGSGVSVSPLFSAGFKFSFCLLLSFSPACHSMETEVEASTRLAGLPKGPSAASTGVQLRHTKRFISTLARAEQARKRIRSSRRLRRYMSILGRTRPFVTCERRFCLTPPRNPTGNQIWVVFQFQKPVPSRRDSDSFRKAR